MSSEESVSLWLVFHKNKLIISSSDHQLIDESEAGALRHAFVREHKLGNMNNCDLYCAELNKAEAVSNDYELISLRQALDVLGDNWYQAATKAKSIITWDKTHTFCGACGRATVHTQAYERYCETCELAFFPRMSPSIIVLIEKGNKILMARGSHFPEGIYGLIAGFVEPGESIEQAVHREVMEEVGIQVKNLRYYGSQAWPFPDSLMVGFYAEYESGELKIDEVELEDAGWFGLDSLPGRPSSEISIASKLLNDYINNNNR